ncbi:MAG TPA: biotin--[acetyl-CoA-carboxylase] ligase [Anaerolineae bacterium]|nr:biotin--[acetyl-CoA-carboxylase] ligase [Anaerolineae bacterium]
MGELTVSQIEKRLITKWLGREYIYWPEIGSTNEWLKQAEQADLPHGTVALTDYQSAGKGRQGRSWQAPAGSSLLFSSLYHLDWPVAQAGWLTMLAGTAVVTTLRQQTTVPIGLKWPNDIMIEQNGRWHKMGGMLSESIINNQRLDRAILGIGLNINIEPADLPTTSTPATSLLAATGQTFDRAELLAQLLFALEAGVEKAVAGQNPQPVWQDLLITLNQDVVVTYLHEDKPPLLGRAIGTDESGHLLVEDKDGAHHLITAADVTLRKEH